ncbi:MAG: hypothetical protein LAO79_05530 [Acidobacteriia bacterium]|nr:hypothetical protein [Terriglobia bacterium]
MKTEVYSWRVSAELKSGLAREARRRKLSLSAVLDQAAREWLKTAEPADEEQEQRRIREAASKYIGALAGDDPRRAENASRIVREKLRRRYGR